MKVIVTGATGFLGRNLTKTFHEEGLQILATGRSPVAADALRRRGIEFRAADILDQEQLHRAFSPADCVVHCAGKSGPWGRFRDHHLANVVGTRNVVEACRTHDIRKIVFISTPSIYFTGEDRFDVSESDPIPERQTTHYSKTNLDAEKELMGLHGEGIKVVIFRPRALYGPYDTIFVPRILRMAESGRVPLINGGRALVDITCTGNFVDAVRSSLAAPDDAWNQAYNICNGDPITVRDWFSQILHIFDRPFEPKNVPESVARVAATVLEFISLLPLTKNEPSMTRSSVEYLAKSMTMSIGKAKAKLGYTPRLTNQQGFERYAEWYHRESAGDS